MTRIWKFAQFWILLFFVSCGPATFEDLRCEGEVQVKKLASELSAIETKEELQKAIPRLRKRFNQIADLLIESKKFSCPEAEPSFASEELFSELARIYEMSGGRELIEMAQNEAVQKLRTNIL